MSIFAALDIGTNSVRMGIVEIHDDGSWRLIAPHKEVVRLGEDEFAGPRPRIAAPAMERAVRVLARFAEMAVGVGATKIVALATAASREADNQEEFVERIAKATNGVLDVRVISGSEEARLVYLGIRSGIELPDQERALFMDIGGGSTELVVGDANEYFFLDSLKLGAIRMTSQFIEGRKTAITPAIWSKLQRHVRSMIVPAARAVADFGFSRMYGSSGTIMSLAEIAARRARPSGDAPPSMRNYELTLTDLQSITQMLCRMTVEERRKVPGLSPDRADIIIGGAAILQTAMETVGAASIRVSDRGLREGIVVDHVLREMTTTTQGDGDGIRLHSIRRLAKRCGIDTSHAQHVTAIALSIFDQTSAMGLHDLTASRELLDYAGLVHDCGFFVSHTGHHAHSYYLIRNSELLGFDDIEVEIMAQIAFYHRKAGPRRKDPHFAHLTDEQKQAVRILSCCLRLAEALDRGHIKRVTGIELAWDQKTTPIVTARLKALDGVDASLEVWALQAHAGTFEKTFGVALKVVAPPGSTATAPRPALPVPATRKKPGAARAAAGRTAAARG